VDIGELFEDPDRSAFVRQVVAKAAQAQ